MLPSPFQEAFALTAERFDDRLTIYASAGGPACTEPATPVVSGARVTATEIVVLVYEAHYPSLNLFASCYYWIAIPSLKVMVMSLFSLFSSAPFTWRPFPSVLSSSLPTLLPSCRGIVQAQKGLERSLGWRKMM